MTDASKSSFLPTRKFASTRRRKRRYWFQDKALSEGATATEDGLSTREVPTPLSTASGKKLALSKPSTGTPLARSEQIEQITEPGLEKADYCLINIQKLRESVRKFAHCVCGASLDVHEQLSFRKGVSTKMSLFCAVCNEYECFSDPHVDSKSINARTVVASRFCGLGCDHLRMFTALLGIPPSVSAPSYTEHNVELAKFSAKEASASYALAAVHLHRMRGVDPDEVIDVTITLDGTWSRRGHVAHYGVVVAISWETGQVLDTAILSNSCRECVAHRDWDENSEEYVLWKDNHEETCNQNYVGTSNSMEMNGAVDIFLRSVSKNKLRYTKVISDGDAKTVVHLNGLNNGEGPYGAGLTIVRHECVGHVQKRLGKLLRDLRKKAVPIFGEQKDDRATKAAQAAANKVARDATQALVVAAKKEANDANKKARAEAAATRRAAVGAKGRARPRGRGAQGRAQGRATQLGRGAQPPLVLVQPAQITPIVAEKVDPVMRTVQLPWTGIHGLSDVHMLHLQQYYGKAIHSNVGDVEAMKEACWAVFYHSASTDSDPDHRCCPRGEDSWCRFNRALARGEPPPPHRPRIPTHLRDSVKLVFTKHLCDELLLQRCELGASQNQNESFNSLVWERCHKIRYCSLASVEIAVHLAVLIFNGGLKATARMYESFVGAPLSDSAAKLFASKDAIRVMKARKKAEATTKEHRQSLRSVVVRLECSLAESEGLTYVSGGGFT